MIWLDIEHTDGKRYMTWDSSKFPTPERMQNSIAEKGRHMVNIVDPHIKRVSGYVIHDEATRLGYYIKDRDDKDYDGSIFLSLFHARTRGLYLIKILIDPTALIYNAIQAGAGPVVLRGSTSPIPKWRHGTRISLHSTSTRALPSICTFGMI